MATTYYVIDEGSGVLNPGERPLRSLDRAGALAAKAAEDCSWTCLTPPAPDNEMHVGKGNFRCGATAAHGIHIRESVDGYWGEEHDVPEESFRPAKRTQRADWHLNVVVDRGTGALADGDTDLYYTGPEQTDTSWDRIVEEIAGDDEVVSATVRPVPQGRYHDEQGNRNSYPMTWERGYGF